MILCVRSLRSYCRLCIVGGRGRGGGVSRGCLEDRGPRLLKESAPPSSSVSSRSGPLSMWRGDCTTTTGCRPRVRLEERSGGAAAPDTAWYSLAMARPGTALAMHSTYVSGPARPDRGSAPPPRQPTVIPETARAVLGGPGKKLAV